ncbi:PREDICTED: putative ribonuclease H protein At1g65750-like [Fragaria vesca subsp. vesca]
MLEATVKAGDSYAWRSLMKGVDLLKQGVRFQIGTGSSVSVWNDPWLPRPYTFKPYSGVMEGLEDLMVGDLIDPDTSTWMVDLLEELFYADEVEMIRKIPLSIRSPDDRLIWHFDKHGLYSVRSGYHLAGGVNADQSRGSSSSPAGSNKTWKQVWKVRVLPKVKSFVWRLMRNILPTKVALSKKICMEEQLCPFCRTENETALHLFKECSGAACMLIISPLGLRARNHGANNMEEWVVGMMDVLTTGQVEMFFMLLWALWVERNNMVWQGTSFDPINTVTWSMLLLQEYQNLHPCETKLKRRKVSERWKFPPSGRLKLNFDGAYRDDGWGGAGVIVRDEQGEIRHIYREANNAAHRLACFASLDRVVELRLAEAPVYIHDVLFEDKCNAQSEARVRGSLSLSELHSNFNINNGCENEPLLG